MNNTVEIPPEQLIEQIKKLGPWQEKYRYLMKLGSQLNKTSATEKSEKNLVQGCESQVWLSTGQLNQVYYFDACSDSRIVSGLIVLLLAALNHKTASQILNFDITGYFSELGLSQQLSQSRNNGLMHIYEHIKKAAQP
ncbi:SufE family protein [Catenovulum adriaticum]|uniref:SufE family protein n=1 Tax=Catenovulum adriaticum TaxID=2984846 RepID=A0ABY7AIT6_9ALTE|nr:SufE family protein [Catenovulum sp. TS8]WAJ69006.1 SufE family protein [Catenovulum sp. TS8]